MDESVRTEVRALETMTPRELRAKWREVFGEKTRCDERQYMVKRLAWRIQANADGSTSERSRRRRSSAPGTVPQERCWSRLASRGDR